MKKWIFCLFGLASISLASAQTIQLVPFITSGLSLPVGVYFAPGSNKLYIVQQRGKIMLADPSGTVSPNPFLDITSLVSQSGNERGLLGLAFHPDYANNGFFYVNYTKASNGNTVIARYQRSAGNPDAADPNSEMVLMEIAQPYSNHNGGQLHFGPDGYLYIGMGDGGSAGDPQNNAQNLNSHLGKMLRLDVNNGNPYAVPPSNPFVGNANAKPEIWSLGLRNPWCFSFDKVTGDLWIADVGQNAWEEINRQPSASTGGENYGWRCYEGAGHPYNTSGCGPVLSYTLPVAEYGHSGAHCSVTGGYVYRGALYGDLYGKYIFTDYCSGAFWVTFPNSGGGFTTQSLTQVNAPVTNSLSAFGQDHEGELYVVGRDNNRIYKLISTNCVPSADIFTANGYSFGFCPNDTLLLYAPFNAGHTYQWFFNGMPISGNPGHVLPVTQAGSYQVVVTSSGGCSDTSMVVNVTQTSIVPPHITNSSTTFCQNHGPVALSADVPGGSWSGPGVSGNTFNPESAGLGSHNISYTVLQNGCPAQDVETFTVLPTPAVSFQNLPAQICQNETLILEGTPSGGVFQGPGVSGNVLYTTGMPEGPITLSYAYTAANGCSDTAKATLQVVLCTSFPEYAKASLVKVFPNPLHDGRFTISLAPEAGKLLQIRVSDLQGGRIYQEQPTCSNICPIFLGHIPSGIYILTVETEGGIQRQIIVSR